MKPLVNLFFSSLQLLSQIFSGVRFGFRNKDHARWAYCGYPVPVPQEIKMATLRRWGGRGLWVETGTYKGLTSKELSEFSSSVITLEPSPELYIAAKENLSKIRNITIVNGSSEEFFQPILEGIAKDDTVEDVSFWLDGHYSAGETFRGASHTPVLEELSAIARHLSGLKKVSILIDDVRLFRGSSNGLTTYPPLTALISWAEAREMFWTIEYDIFIITNRFSHVGQDEKFEKDFPALSNES